MRRRAPRALRSKKQGGAPGFLVWNKAEHAWLAASEPERLSALLAGTAAPMAEHEEGILAAKRSVEDAIEHLSRIGVTHVRTDLSWANWSWDQGRRWASWCIKRYAERFSVLPCLTYTPPNLGMCRRTNAPPMQPVSYAEFVADAIGSLGHCFEEVELWNEWNLDTDWDLLLDPDYWILSRMLAEGAIVARHYGKRTVFGGCAGTDDPTLTNLSRLAGRGLMRCFDVVGFHGLRGTWGDRKPAPSIPSQLRAVRGSLFVPITRAELLRDAIVRDAHHASAPVREILLAGCSRVTEPVLRMPSIWLTEYGFPVSGAGTERSDEELEDIQAALFAYATYLMRSRQVERVYWYTLGDLPPGTQTIRGLLTDWNDDLQLSYGIISVERKQRRLGRLLAEGGADRVLSALCAEGKLPLVDAASLGRILPADYVTNNENRHRA
ncbi:MAG TPA: hypothetical protein VFL98_01070 [Candidatus Paceibacterota bacterium]|nr:hypothetical protein [Candidatus Paceibacterota bacterium]